MSTRVPRRIVVDTNVLAIAEGLNDDACDLCRSACFAIARMVKEGVIVTLDAGDLIVTEYMRVLGASKTDGVGRKLAHRIYRLRKSGVVCHMVKLTPTESPAASFEEVPPLLRDFDEDDQKFVAVAASDGVAIYAGLDGEWWDRQEDFAASGISVQFPCSMQLMEREAQH
jgi:hypothetical protein